MDSGPSMDGLGNPWLARAIRGWSESTTGPEQIHDASDDIVTEWYRASYQWHIYCTIPYPIDVSMIGKLI